MMFPDYRQNPAFEKTPGLHYSKFEIHEASWESRAKCPRKNNFTFLSSMG